MIKEVIDINKAGSDLEAFRVDLYGRTPSHLMAALITWWPLIRAALRLARIFGKPRVKSRIDEIFDLFDNLTIEKINLK